MRTHITIRIPIPLWFRRLADWLNSLRPSQRLIELQCRCRVPQDAPYNVRLYSVQEIEEYGRLFCIRCGADPLHATQ